MTGVADLYLMLRHPQSQQAYVRLKDRIFRAKPDKTRFVVLSWKRTGSNLLCGILYHHPEIIMHNELFNNIDIFTYYPECLTRGSDANESRWTVLARDLFPDVFLHYIWSAKLGDGTNIREKGKAVGFKSFPEHWRDSNNQDCWLKSILLDCNIKKVILFRESEIEVFISMMRAEITGSYMTHRYPGNLKVTVDPAKFQAFVNNYRHTFQRAYNSPNSRQDTFRLTYEQLVDTKHFENKILPLLWTFLGVDAKQPRKLLNDTVKQSEDDEKIADVISNFDDLEFCFRHTDVKLPRLINDNRHQTLLKQESNLNSAEGTWSLLLPICSRQLTQQLNNSGISRSTSSVNRFSELVSHSQHTTLNSSCETECWMRLQKFAESLKLTTTKQSRKVTECVVAIDVDDRVFGTKEARARIREILPLEVQFVDIQPAMYGKVCRIWNLLARMARNDFIVLLGDDVRLLDVNWQKKIERKFEEIARKQGLPFGAACVVFNDISFRCFPTFPVIHRWHMHNFRQLLPRQFVNQGADPYLFELYKRWNASSFVMDARLENDIGGDNGSRYLKHTINWPGLILQNNLKALRGFLKSDPSGICIDVIVPSYRCHNAAILREIVGLRASIPLNTMFWIIVDNPDPIHLQEMQDLARNANDKSENGGYFVRVVSYGENRGASYARNTGYNYSTADYVLFLDDDVWPDRNILDAYAGAIRRYPEAKVFVGLTEMPTPVNLWTKMLATSNVMFFYGIAKHRTHPPWGVTANLMVRGARHNHTIQFKDIYPKTGGGEDIDFVFQMKAKYDGNRSVVSVPGAKVKHPWWSHGKVCYGQICGWAWGDSRCMSEWPKKTFRDFPNCAELTLLLLLALMYSVLLSRNWSNDILKAFAVIFILDHLWKGAFFMYILQTRGKRTGQGRIESVLLALGASTVISAQEFSRVGALIWRREWQSFCKRMDWFDGSTRSEVLDHQLKSGARCGFFLVMTWYLILR